MGHGNKAANADNNHHWPPGKDTLLASSTVLAIPDSLGFVKVKATSGQNVDTLDTEWWEGRVINIWVEDGSSTITFRRNQTASNVYTTGLTLAVAARNAITFRAVRDTSGNKVWHQMTSVSFS